MSSLRLYLNQYFLFQNKQVEYEEASELLKKESLITEFTEETLTLKSQSGRRFIPLDVESLFKEGRSTWGGVAMGVLVLGPVWGHCTQPPPILIHFVDIKSDLVLIG